MGTIYYVADLPGKRWADIDKAHDLADAVFAADLTWGEPVLTSEFLTAFLAVSPDEEWRVGRLLRWQREVCGGRALSMWGDWNDDRPWRDWDAPNADREGWTEDDPMTPKWWTDREPSPPR